MIQCIAATTNLGCFVRLWTLERSQYHYNAIYTYLDSLFNRLLGLTSKKNSKLRINSPALWECPSQRASNAESVSMSWYHHVAPLLSEHRRTVTEEDDDVIKWKHFPRYWPFVRGIHRAPVNSTHKGQWRGALMFSLIWAGINGWVNNREAGDLRRYRAHYDVSVVGYIGNGPYILIYFLWWCQYMYIWIDT